MEKGREENRMRILIVLKNIIIVTFLLLMTGIVASAYFTLKPPASVVTTLLRMVNQLVQKYLVIALTLVFIISFTIICFRWKNKVNPGGFLIFCTIIIAGCLFANVFSLLQLSNAKARKCNIKYNDTAAGKDRNIDLESYVNEDLSDETGLDQCSVYTSVTSPYQDICLIYLNYGGWSMQNESFGNQIYEFCKKEGYTFVRVAYNRKPEEKIDVLLDQTNRGINQLLQLKDFQHIYLCGGSAGGHMALLSAFTEQETEEVTVLDKDQIDGVIALYPNVDPGYQYDYYMQADEHKKNIIDHFGDSLYCSLYHGTTGTLAGETKILDNQVFGEREDQESFYDSTKIADLIKDQNIPVLLVQGSLDSMIAVDSVRTFYTYLKEQNKTAVYLELPGAEHVFDMMDTSAWDRCEKEMTGFIRQIELQ